eukprot:gene37091-50037_t
MGVGFGIALSGTLVPLLLNRGITVTWLGLGIVAVVFTILGWKGWRAPPAQPEPDRHAPRRLPQSQLRGLYLIYGLNAFALVPHMVFLVAFVARGLGQGLATATQYWVLFGLGALVGPLIAGRAADRWGARTTMIAALAGQLLFIALPVIDSSPLVLIASSLAMGAATIGIVPVALARIREALQHHPSAHFAAWRTATASFALLQAAGAYAMSFLLDWSQGSYRLLFGAALAGPLSDRIGRKPVLLASVTVFGLFSLGTAMVHAYAPLLAVRFLTGLGLGGAMPMLIAMASELASPKRRTFIVSSITAGLPMGGALVGLLARRGAVRHYGPGASFAVEACLKLMAAADGIIEGFRPGVMERLGLGPDVALKRNPKLVYGRMTGWGQTGPYSNAAGHDMNYIAITGALHAIGTDDKPVPPLNLVGDFGGGALYLAFGLMAGIIQARET